MRGGGREGGTKIGEEPGTGFVPHTPCLPFLCPTPLLQLFESVICKDFSIGHIEGLVHLLGTPDTQSITASPQPITRPCTPPERERKKERERKRDSQRERESEREREREKDKTKQGRDPLAGTGEGGKRGGRQEGRGARGFKVTPFKVTPLQPIIFKAEATARKR